MSVEEDRDEVAAGAADVDGDVPQCEVAFRIDPAVNNSQTVGHLQDTNSYSL